jgi:hypothetical protein
VRRPLVIRHSGFFSIVPWKSRKASAVITSGAGCPALISRKNLPLSQCETVIEDRRAMILVRRTRRRFLRSEGLRRGAKSSVRLYTEEHPQWARVIDWAKMGTCQPIDFAAPLVSQPF